MTNEEYERIVIAFLLKDVKYISISDKLLKSEFFTTPMLKVFYKAIRKSYENWHSPLDNVWFEKLMAKSGKLKSEEEMEYALELRKLQKLEINEAKFSYYVDIIKNVAVTNELAVVVEKYSKKLKGDLVNGEEIINGLSNDIHKLKSNTGILEIKRGFVYEDVEKRILEYDDRKKAGAIPGIPFAWAELDKLTGGHYKQEMTTFFSRTGGGKSRALHNVAYNATVAGYKGLFVTVEMPGNEIARLYDARLTKLHFDKIKKSQLNDDEELKWKGLLRLMEMNQKQKGFYIVDVPSGCTPETIYQEVNEYERRFGKLDYVVVDYLLLLEATKKTRNRVDMVGEVAKELKEIARSKDISMITATQANREALEVEVQSDVGTQHVAISDQIAHHSDVMLYLWRSTQDKIKNKIQVNLAKFRYGGGLTFELYADWNKNFIGDKIWQIDMERKEIRHEE